MAKLREKYWLIQGREQVKRVLRSCSICTSLTSRHFTEPPTSIPIERATEADAFQISGVDFAGPLYIKDTNGFSKAYICLFTCAVTRAIHLELVSSLTTEDFLMALRRFFSRRRVSSIIYSDNGKTFKKAAKQLQSLVTAQRLAFYLAEHRVEWRFIPNRAPWWGGFYERLVRSVKDLLKRSLGRASLTFDQMMTLTTEIEGIVNSRPLYYSSNDHNEPQAITPKHFLIGEIHNTNQDPSLSTSSSNLSTKEALTRKEKYRKSLLQIAWKQWRENYLLDLKRFAMQIPRKSRPINKGDIVLIRDTNQPRLFWKHGLVQKLIKGRSGKVKMVDLKTATGYTNRPIECLYPTELNCIKEENESERVIYSQPQKNDDTQSTSDITMEDSLIEPRPPDGSRGEYVEKESTSPTINVERTTRSGRVIHEPRRLGISKTT